MNKLTDIHYWEETHATPSIALDENNLIKKWIESHLDFSNIKNCFEIGCYPGRYLSIFAEKGIEVNGLDYIPGVTELNDIFKARGYRTGNFFCGDFLNVTMDRKYNCVFSLGFIEHFRNWEEVFVKHFDFLADNGIVIIEVPNFKGWMQWLPRFLFDHENLKRHNMDSMNLDQWRLILLKNNFNIVYSGYFGGYSLWFEGEIKNRIIHLMKIIVVKTFRIIRNFVFRNKKDDKSFSAAMGIIAVKKH